VAGSDLGEPVRRGNPRPTLPAIANSLRSDRVSDGRQGPEPQVPGPGLVMLAQRTEDEPMSEKRSRRRWTAQKKLKLVLESMEGSTKLADICRREGLSPNLLHLWRKQLLGAAEDVFGRKSKTTASTNGAEQRLRQENDRMKGVIAEITAENLDLKKTLSD